MILLTKNLKSWLTANADVPADADDNQFKQAAGMAIATGSLAMEKFVQLTKDEKATEAGEFSKQLKELGSSILELTKMVKAGKEFPPKKDDEEEEEDDEEAKAKKKKLEAEAEESKAKKGGNVEWHKSIKRMMNMAPPANEDGTIRVKGAWEQYSTTKSALTYPNATKAGRPHALAGRPVMDMGRPLDEPSQLDKAVSGVYAKLLIATAQRGGSKSMGFHALPEHDREILFHAMDKMDWVGSTDGGDYADIKGRRLTPHEQKALIDDSTSGGLEAAPIVFDDQVIQAPLLHGELFPLVNQIPLDRGRRIEGVATGTVTAAWGGIDATAIDLFTTTSYVSAFDTTIYRWEGAFQIGLDFLSDTPIDFGAHVTAQYGERLLEDLDDVIAVGNGTTQPQGVMNKSGVTSVSFGGTTSIGNYESLRFGVAKAEHKSNMTASAVFCGNETSYARMKALPVGSADARRLYGTGGMGTTGYDNYSMMDRPYKINGSMANTQVFYAILARYRMYRRKGLTMRTSTEGSTLIRSNSMLIVCMARYGGQLERGACAAVTTTAPA